VKASRREHFARWAIALREQGILIPPSPYEAMFVSTAHTAVHVKRCVEASREAFQSLAAA
jgi:glutamate-1-semialdehyde 2,1-aminomutase